MIGICLLGIIACNVLVLILATRNAARREAAKLSAGNVIELRYYRRDTQPYSNSSTLVAFSRSGQLFDSEY